MIVLPYPPLANRYWRIKRGHAKPYRSTKAKVYIRTLRKLLPHRPTTNEVAVSMIVYRPQRSGDLDGTFKILLDALQGLLYVNDSQVAAIRARRSDADPKNPRVELELEDLGPRPPRPKRDRKPKPAYEIVPAGPGGQPLRGRLLTDVDDRPRRPTAAVYR